jgi:AAA+ superfamily predicted ATPase
MKTDKLINHLRAGFSLFWLNTHEPNRVRKEIYSQIQGFQRKDGTGYKALEWSCTKGEEPLKQIISLIQADDEDGKCKVLFLYNFHWFIDQPKAIQTLQDVSPVLSSRGHAIVIVSPKKSIPMELEREFVLMEMDLPNTEEIFSVMRDIYPESLPELKKEDPTTRRIVDSCRSLTQTELEQVLSLSLIEGIEKGNGFDVKVINDYRSMAIQKTGFIEILPSDITFSNMIGYDNFKQFVMETIDHPEAKGVMTIGPPGCGKTNLMKAIIGETKKFGLAVNMGSLFSKYQGETDQNVNTVINIIRSVGDCFVLIDEFEKQFAGSSSDGSLDSGTTKRATSRWLDFLQNRPENVYICGTANSFVGIPPEYLRPGRWDTSPFFIDLPSVPVRKGILEYYVGKKGLKVSAKDYPEMKDFTGAEIEALVHIASMRKMTLKAAEKCIIPQIVTAKDQINALRQWAKTSCIPAEAIPSTKSNNGSRKIDI